MRLPSDTLELAQLMARRLDGAAGYLQRWFQYYDGTQPGAYMSPESIEALHGRLPTLSPNFCRLAALSLQERLRITGFLIDGASEPDPEVWDSFVRSGMHEGSDVIHVESFIYGRAYGMCWVDEYGDPVWTPESPMFTTTITDPVTRRELAAMKRYWLRPDPDQPTGQGVAIVMTPDRVVTLTTDDDVPISGYPPMGGAWHIVESLPNPAGRVPVVNFVNQYAPGSLSTVEGTSELADLAPLVDAIAKLSQDLMVSSEVAARPRRYAAGLQLVSRRDEDGEPVLDEDGNEVFENPFSDEAGRVWQSENPETKFGQFPGADLSSYGQAIQTLTSQVGAISTLPPAALGQWGDQPPSADSLRAAEASITSRATGKIRALTPAWGRMAALDIAMRTGRDPATVRAVPTWSDPSTRTPTQDVDEAAKLSALGIPTPVLLREVLGWSDDQIASVRTAGMQAQQDAASLNFATGQGAP